ncbi:unnamed protein product [Nyctereutes procyonoides]|uniref:(raccoon dog) hypothetical protein n=1 Tax=Nyctereutes procyonoides TaxID=34880 RepID=A0A811Y1R3_NYCPR|nr:unnamed protein product [Nyctereutes procyonoides]
MCLVLLLLLWLSPAAPNQETGSCSQPRPVCCPGSDTIAGEEAAVFSEPRVVPRVVLRPQKPVHRLLQASLPGLPLSISMKGIKKRARGPPKLLPAL